MTPWRPRPNNGAISFSLFLVSLMSERPESGSSGFLDNAQEFGSHLLYSTFKAPVSGAYQLADTIVADKLPDWHVQKPESKTGWGTAGDIAGTALLFFGATRLTRGAIAKTSMTEWAGASLARQTGLSMLEAGGAGTLVGLSTPVDPSKDFWTEKGRVTAQHGVSFAAMGGAGKLLPQLGVFGEAGKRSLMQSVSLGASSGAVGGVADSFAHAGLYEGRLPTLGETATNTASYAAFGSVFGASEYAAPHAVRAAKGAWEKVSQQWNAFNTPTVRPQLAYRVEGTPTASGRQEVRPQTSEPKTLEVKADSPLPDFKGVAPLTYAAETPISASALAQSKQYATTGVVDQPFANGVRLTTSARSDGISDAGLPIARGERFVVLDQERDPVFKAIMEDSRKRLQGITDKEELSEAIKQYVRKLFNRYNLPGASVEELYEEIIHRYKGPLIPIGEFIRRGTAACLPRSALMKAIAEDQKLQSRMWLGHLNLGNGVMAEHVWTDLKVTDKLFQIKDASSNHSPDKYSIRTVH